MAMARSTEVGTELEADHRLIELLGRQIQLESDESRRQTLAVRIAGIIDWHELFDRRYLGWEQDAADQGRPRADPGPEASVDAHQPLDSDDGIDVLMARAHQHIQEEEKYTLPKFEARANWMTLEDLGERAREFRLASTVG